MAAHKQIEANRRNSQKSTRLKTEEGKAASSQNAIKHCLHAKDFLLFHGNFDGYEGFRYTLMGDQARRPPRNYVHRPNLLLILPFPPRGHLHG